MQLAEPLHFANRMRADQALTVYPLVNYTFGHKDRVKAESIKDQSLEGKLARMKAQ
jgi:hypothetical protein